MSSNSGIQCTEEVEEYFDKLQRKREFRYIIYRIRSGPGSSSITMEKAADRNNEFRHFVEDLPSDEARFAVYDFSYITPDWNLKDGLLFIFWSPYGASRVEARTMYSSSKQNILRTLRKGTSLKAVEITDSEDLTEANLMEALLPLREKGQDLNLGNAYN